MLRRRPISLARQVAHRVASIRRAREWTPGQLAERLGLATRNLQRLESGAQNLPLQTTEPLEKVLEIHADAIIREPTSPFP
jgi:ribosome-binding protein aMBF1 (putative translation factor)